MKKSLLFCWLMLFSLFSFAQTTLKGRVYDENSKPIRGASVRILNTHYAAISDGEGFFSIPNLIQGNYILHVNSMGYASINRSIKVDAESEILEMALQPAFKQLSEVTISTQKRDELLQSVPLSITSLSSRQVEDYRLWSLSDLTSIAPNLYVADPGDKRNVTAIRGIVSTSYDPAVATYIDGVNQFGLDTYISQLFDVERIEIARGPQGTLYGRNAMGGVIHVITKRPENRVSGFAEVGLSNFSRQRVTAGLKIPLLPNRLFLGAAGLFDRTDGFYQNTFTGSHYDKQHTSSGNYYLKYLTEKSWSFTLNLKHAANRNTGAFPLVFAEQALESPFTLDQNALTGIVDNILNTSLSANYSGRSFNFSSQTAYQTNYRYYKEPIDADFSSLDGMSIINNYGPDWNRVKVYTQEFKLASPADGRSSRFNWTAGTYMFYQHNPVKQTTRFGNDARLLGMGDENFSLINTTRSKNKGIAFFGQADLKVAEKLVLTVGMRYDHENRSYAILGEYQKDPDPAFAFRSDTSATANFSAFSPKVSVAYQATSRNMLFLTYSKGFRGGGLTPLSSDPSQPALSVFNPEFSHNLEAGTKNTLFNQRLTLNLTAFYSSLSDVQVPTLILPDAITIIRNTGELTSKGLELEARSAFKGFELDYSLGYTDARYDQLNVSQGNTAVNLKGRQQLFTPKITSMLAGQYQVKLGNSQDYRLLFRGEWRYLDRQYFDLANTVTQSPYHTLNAKAGLTSKKISFMFWGRNLNDTQYISYAYDFGAVHLGNPRTFGVTVNKSF